MVPTFGGAAGDQAVVTVCRAKFPGRHFNGGGGRRVAQTLVAVDRQTETGQFVLPRVRLGRREHEADLPCIVEVQS